MNVNTSRRTVNKTKKNVYKPTLDVQHNTYISTIGEMSTRKNELAQELKDVERSIKEIEAKLREVDVADDEVVERFIKLKDRRFEINSELKKIENDYNEHNYYTNTANILFDYYDLIEKGNSHTESAANVVTPPAPVAAAKSARPSILDYFSKSSAPPAAAAAETKPQEEAAPVIENTTNNSRGALLAKYMRYADPEYTKTVECHTADDMCAHCGSHKLMVMTNDGYTWCTNCDAIEYIIIDHEKPSYRDPPKEISFFAYKRSNHLNEWISQIQGKETTEIPEEVYDKILMELKKQRISNMANITQKKIKSILKNLGMNKYYEHAAHIVNRLTGMPMKQLSPELEEQLRNMFKMIQTPFLKYAPKNRKNFLSYSFVLHKLVQLLGKDEYLECFSLLRSKEKLYAQDMVWKKICEELNWEFYPSL